MTRDLSCASLTQIVMMEARACQASGIVDKQAKLLAYIYSVRMCAAGVK